MWELRDIVIIGIALLIGLLAFSTMGIRVPLVIAAAYGFLSIRYEGTSILDFVRYAAAFLLIRQQFYEWRVS